MEYSKRGIRGNGAQSRCGQETGELDKDIAGALIGHLCVESRRAPQKPDDVEQTTEEKKA